MIALLLLVVGTVPFDAVVDDTADVAFHNRHYADDGQQLLEQVYWEEWKGGDCAVIAWRALGREGFECRDGFKFQPVPIYNHQTRQWESIWIDGEVMRRVRTKSMIETWTQDMDPELIDRNEHPGHQQSRRELSKPKKRSE